MQSRVLVLSYVKLMLDKTSFSYKINLLKFAFLRTQLKNEK